MSVTRVSFDSSSGSFVDHEDHAFNTATPAVDLPPGPSTRVYTGAVRYTQGEAEAQEVNQSRYSAPIVGTAGASVASTLQSRFGPSASVELQPGRPETRTSVEVAAQMGLIRRDDAGNWIDVGSVDQQAESREQQLNPEQPQQLQQDEQGGEQVMDEEAFRAYADAIEPLPSHAVDVAQAHAMAGVFEGQTLSEVAAEVGQRLAADSGLGLEPAQAAEVVRLGVALYTDSVDRVAALEGVDESMREGFYASLREGNQAGLRDALGKLVHSGDASGFRDLARAYAVRTPSPTAEALQSAGWQVNRTESGWMARPQFSTGQWIPVADLVKHAKAQG